jgi:hypothetical protein
VAPKPILISRALTNNSHSNNLHAAANTCAFEKQWRHACSRCQLPIGYQTVAPPQVPDWTYIFPVSLLLLPPTFYFLIKKKKKKETKLYLSSSSFFFYSPLSYSFFITHPKKDTVVLILFSFFFFDPFPGKRMHPRAR